MAIETVNFKTLFKPYMELVSKHDGMTLTEFINDCIREQLQKRTAFLADCEATKITAKQMGIPEIENSSIEKIKGTLPEEKLKSFIDIWSIHHTDIDKKLQAYFRNEGIPGENGEIVEAPIIW